MQKKMRVQSRALGVARVGTSADSAEKAARVLQEEADLVGKLVQQMRIAERAQAATALVAEVKQSAAQNSRGELARNTDKLLFSIPKQSKIFQMDLASGEVTTFVEPGMVCPALGKTSMGQMATAMMGRPEFLAVDVESNKAFWGDWLGGTGGGSASYNASVLSTPLDSPQIDPVVTSAFYPPPPKKPGCRGQDNWACPPADFHVPTGDLPITHLDSPYAIAVDPVAKMVYWSDRAQAKAHPGGPQKPKIQRASYDGHSTPPEDFEVEGMIGDFLALAIDHREGQRKIYWVEDVNTKTDPKTGDYLVGSQIRRADLDGTGMEVLASYLSRFPVGFALDFLNDQLYWTEYVGGRIQRCPLTGCTPGEWNVGSEPELVLQTFEGGSSSTTPKLGALALDPANSVMYWTEDHEYAPPPGESAMIYGGMVKRAKLDGSDVEELYRFSTTNSLQAASPRGLAIVINTPRTGTGE